MTNINAFNKFFVGSQGKDIVIGNSPFTISADDALLFAAWLVVIAESYASHSFKEVLSAVQNT